MSSSTPPWMPASTAAAVRSADVLLRGSAVTYMTFWQHPRALEALLHTVRDPVLADCAGDMICRSLAVLAPQLDVGDFSEFVRMGVETPIA